MPLLTDYAKRGCSGLCRRTTLRLPRFLYVTQSETLLGLPVGPVREHVGWVDAREVNRVRATLASVPRKDQRAKGDCCLRGLMLDGRRKSIQAMAGRPSGVLLDALQNTIKSRPACRPPVRFPAGKTPVSVLSHKYEEEALHGGQPAGAPDRSLVCMRVRVEES